jgi:hypothetical protein
MAKSTTDYHVRRAGGFNEEKLLSVQKISIEVHHNQVMTIIIKRKTSL